jgi:hypothetical protein
VIEDIADSDMKIFNQSKLPQIQIRNTYYQLAKVNVFRLKIKEAVEGFTVADQITRASLPEEGKSLYSAKCGFMIKEAHIKNYNSRNKKPLEDADKAVRDAQELVTSIVGDKSNYLNAKGLLHQGDVLV